MLFRVYHLKSRLLEITKQMVSRNVTYRPFSIQSLFSSVFGSLFEGMDNIIIYYMTCRSIFLLTVNTSFTWKRILFQRVLLTAEQRKLWCKVL